MARTLPLPLWEGVGGRGLKPSCLEVPGLRIRVARRPPLLRITDARRDIPQPVADQPHAHAPRRLPHGADADLVVHQQLPDLLRVLVAPLGLQPRRLAEQLPDLQYHRIVRLRPLRTIARVI